MTSEEMAALHDRSFTTPRAWSAVEFDALLASPGAFLETATEGFLLGRVIAGEAELLTLAVAPSARRAGQGRRLLAAVERNAFLEVAADNGPAIALYAGAGWETRGTRRAYYQRPDGSRVDAVVMSKPLA
jgi:ribosomal-protein-alanine N-acetyltransferase